MPEGTIEYSTNEYGPDIILGMPQGQKIKVKEAIYSGTHIVEEYDFTGRQNLKIEDIVEELKKLPNNIRKYIKIVVLSPFIHPNDNADDPALADAKWEIAQVTIYASPCNRTTLKDILARHLTLAHEAGHIIDRRILQNTECTSYYLSYTPQWTKAMCEDSKIKRISSDLPSYLISRYAEHRQSIGEDFADSVMYFSHPAQRAFLKENYPNRYKILEEFLEPTTQ
jgi:hypothetical protein